MKCYWGFNIAHVNCYCFNNHCCILVFWTGDLLKSESKKTKHKMSKGSNGHFYYTRYVCETPCLQHVVIQQLRVKVKPWWSESGQHWLDLNLLEPLVPYQIWTLSPYTSKVTEKVKVCGQTNGQTDRLTTVCSWHRLPLLYWDINSQHQYIRYCPSFQQWGRLTASWILGWT